MERHKNGRCYNKYYGIPNSKKIWSFRNALYNEKYINAVWLAQFLSSYYQSGGNMNETMHAWLEKEFQWILNQTMGVIRIPGYQEIKKMAYNFMKASKLINKKRSDFKRNLYFNSELNNKLYQLLNKAIQLDPLREADLDINYGCGVLYFAKAIRDINQLLHGFNYEKCVKRKSYLNSEDYQKLIQLINEYEEQQQLYEQYDEDYEAVGDTILKALKEPNSKLLKHLVHELSYRIPEQKILDMAEGYWKADEDDEDDYSSTDSEDFDYLLNGNTNTRIISNNNYNNIHRNNNKDIGDIKIDTNNNNYKKPTQSDCLKFCLSMYYFEYIYIYI